MWSCLGIQESASSAKTSSSKRLRDQCRCRMGDHSVFWGGTTRVQGLRIWNSQTQRMPCCSIEACFDAHAPMPRRAVHWVACQHCGRGECGCDMHAAAIPGQQQSTRGGAVHHIRMRQSNTHSPPPAAAALTTTTPPPPPPPPSPSSSDPLTVCGGERLRTVCRSNKNI